MFQTFLEHPCVFVDVFFVWFILLSERNTYSPFCLCGSRRPGRSCPAFSALQPSIWVWRGPEPAPASVREKPKGIWGLSILLHVSVIEGEFNRQFWLIKIMFADPRSQ